MRKTYIQKMGCRGSSRDQSKLVIIMAAVIIVLALLVVYSLALKPAFNGYVVEKQTEAQYMVVNTLLGQLDQSGYIQIPISEDEAITLVKPESCYEILGLEQPQQSMQQQVAPTQ